MWLGDAWSCLGLSLDATGLELLKVDQEGLRSTAGSWGWSRAFSSSSRGVENEARG